MISLRMSGFPKALIVALAVFCSVPAISQKQELSLDEAVMGQFRQYYPEHLDQLSWLPESENYVYVRNDSVIVGTPKRKEKFWFGMTQLSEWCKPVVEKSLKGIPVMNWKSAQSFWFQDGSNYIVVDTRAGSATILASDDSGAQNVDFHEGSGRIAYTKANDLFVKVNGKTTQITSNPPHIVSGQSISRNEYGISKGTFWSGNGEKLAFYQKDEHQVTEYPLINYTTEPASVNPIRYPMSGSPSEIVSVGVYDVATDKKVFLQLTDKENDDQFYATNLCWSPDASKIYIIWLNRATTEAKLMEYDASSGKSLRMITRESDERWVEPLQPITFIPGNDQRFLWYSWRDGFHNYYLYETNGKLLGQTKASFELKEIIGFNSAGTEMYVYGTGEQPVDMHAYAVRLTDMGIRKLTGASGIHEVQVSKSGKYFLDTWSSMCKGSCTDVSRFSGEYVPNQTDLVSTEGRIVKNLLTAADPLAGKKIGNTRMFTITNADGTDLWCRMITPSEMEEGRKYPVVVYVYNGPHVQLVQNNWLGGSSLWMNHLAEKGYIIFTLDGRGSSNRGKSFEQGIHRQLGTLELQDQMTGIDWLKKQGYVDADRIGIHGWSFGGFMTTSMMLREPGACKVGVAGGPVIDWSLYEVMYTERYMDTPEENPQGYTLSNLSNHAPKLQDKLLLIHGADDDVVVMQHSMKMLKACIDKKEQIDFFVYPGHKHNVRGIDRVHLMRKVIEYLTENL